MNYENKKRFFYLNEIYYDFLLLEYFLPIERKTRHFKMFSFQASSIHNNSSASKITNFLKFLTFLLHSIPFQQVQK